MTAHEASKEWYAKIVSEWLKGWTVGKHLVVQVKTPESGVWVDWNDKNSFPVYSITCDYRIKPKQVLYNVALMKGPETYAKPYVLLVKYSDMSRVENDPRFIEWVNSKPIIEDGE